MKRVAFVFQNTCLFKDTLLNNIKAVSYTHLVTEIASKIGYENPNKFTSAFKETYGSSPTEFRKSVRLDRSGSVWSGEEI